MNFQQGGWQFRSESAHDLLPPAHRPLHCWWISLLSTSKNSKNACFHNSEQLTNVHFQVQMCNRTATIIQTRCTNLLWCIQAFKCAARIWSAIRSAQVKTSPQSWVTGDRAPNMQTARQAASSPECLQACHVSESPHKVPQTLDFARTCNNFVFLCLWVKLLTMLTQEIQWGLKSTNPDALVNI